jgi:hypothetical protein
MVVRHLHALAVEDFGRIVWLVPRFHSRRSLPSDYGLL